MHFLKSARLLLKIHRLFSQNKIKLIKTILFFDRLIQFFDIWYDFGEKGIIKNVGKLQNFFIFLVKLKLDSIEKKMFSVGNSLYIR